MSNHAAPPQAALRWLTAATAGLGTAALVALYATSVAPDVSQAAEPAPGPPQAATEAATGIAPIFTTPPPPAAQPWSEDDGPIYVADPTPSVVADVADRTATPTDRTKRSERATATADRPARQPVADPRMGTGEPPAGTSPPADVAGDPPAAGSAQLDTVLELVNSARAEAGCPPLTDDPDLTAFASDWAQQMAEAGVMSHSDGPYAENVAVGYVTAAEVMQGWMGSPGHRNNILTCEWTQHGIGSAIGADGRTYWTQVFST